MKNSLRFALVALLCTCPLVSADTLVTADGRVIEVKKARLVGDTYRLEFEPGEILCPEEMVASVEMEGDMSEYVPKDDREREFLEKGYVRYKGKWLSKERYRIQLERQAEKRRERTEELAKHADFKNAWEKETKHFLVRSNTSPELLDHYAELLETYYALMDDRIGIKPTPTMRRTKMTVNVFKRREELHEYIRSDEDEEGENEGLLGFFWPGDKSLNFYHDFKDPGLSQVTALHECTHLLMYLVDQDFWPPIWIDEAIADYYGTTEIERDKKGKLSIEPGSLQMDLVLTMQEAIEAGKHTPLAELFLVEDEDFNGFQYANAWSFAYFLQNSPEYAKNFNRFSKDLYALKLKGCKPETIDMGFGDKTGIRRQYKREDVSAALLKQLKVKDVVALEEEWTEFVAAIPIDGAEARFRRGYSRVFHGEGTPKEALEDLNAAIEAGYESGSCYWARGVAHIFTGKWGPGTADIRRAVELDPLDANYRAELAWALTGWFGEGEKIVGRPEDLAEAELQFGLAAVLEPENDLWEELYRKYMKLRANQ